jgi:hypothetical protein
VRALVQVARPVRVQVLVQVARLALALVRVAPRVQALALALVLALALAEHLPQLMLRQLQSRCQLELCRLL